MYSRILWMNDLSRRSDACLEPVRSLAALQGATVTLAHASGSRIQGRKRSSSRGVDANPSILPAILEHAESHLADLEKRLGEAGVACDVRILPGKAEHVAASLVGDFGFDLVVAGTTGVTGLDRLLLGSNAIRFMRKMSVPVLVVGTRSFRTVEALLCPVDLDHPEQARGIEYATSLAHAADGTVTFMSVVDPTKHSNSVDSTEILQVTEERLRAKVELVLGEPLHKHWRARAILDSSPVDGILHAARTHDIVVMCKQGKTGLERLLTGSVAETVVKSCRVSVLVAR